MKKEFTRSWKRSVQPRKQRKYVAKSDLRTKSRFVRSHLSKELREKYGTRSVRIRTGDKVKILRGQFTKTEGKVESVNTKKGKIYISKVEVQKLDGSKAKYPINPSNVLVLELNMDDKKRLKSKKAEKVKK